MKNTIKISIILNTLLILTTIVLILSTQVNKKETNNKTKIEQIIIDTIPPVIELTGTDVTIEENSDYIEPGFKATDNIDQDITDKVVITNNMDIKTPGTYEVIYEVTDSSNNKTKITRTITVKKPKVKSQIKYTTTKTDIKEINDKITNIKDYLKPYKVSVGYINLANGFTYIYNGNKEYFGASLIKVVDAMYIYENNLNDSKNKELVKEAISVSSNSAHSALVTKIGTKNLKTYMQQISSKDVYCNSRFYCQTTVYDQLSYWLYLHYLIEEHPNGNELKSYFINELGNHLSFTQQFDNLHKYGASDTYYHDVGMFYTDTNPYIIVVLTNEVGSYPKRIKYLIRPISQQISELNDLIETYY